MLLLSTETLPESCEIKVMLSIVQVTRAIEISNKGTIRGFLDRDRNEYQEAMNELASSAPRDANAIIGINVSTASQQFSNATYLYITYIGTPIIYQDNS